MRHADGESPKPDDVPRPVVEDLLSPGAAAAAILLDAEPRGSPDKPVAEHGWSRTATANVFFLRIDPSRLDVAPRPGASPAVPSVGVGFIAFFKRVIHIGMASAVAGVEAVDHLQFKAPVPP